MAAEAWQKDRLAAAVRAWLIGREAHARTKAMLPAEPGFVLMKTASGIWDFLEFAQMTPTIGVVVGKGKRSASVAALFKDLGL